jgi:hypothetical protein
VTLPGITVSEMFQVMQATIRSAPHALHASLGENVQYGSTYKIVSTATSDSFGHREDWD